MHLASLGRTRAQGHGTAAAAADGKARKQDWTADHSRRRDARVALFEQALHALEHLRLDDGRHPGKHMLSVALAAAAARLVPVEAHAAAIDRMSEQDVHGADRPGRPTARAIAMLIEPNSNGLDAHRSRSLVSFQEQPEHQPHNLGFHRVDGEPFLDAAATPFHLDGPVAERRPGAVPIPLPGVLLHGAQHVLGILLGLILVEQRDHLAHHDLDRRPAPG